MQLIIKDKVASVDEVVVARLGLTVVEVDGYEEGATSDEKVSLVLYLFIFCISILFVQFLPNSNFK